MNKNDKEEFVEAIIKHPKIEPLLDIFFVLSYGDSQSQDIWIRAKMNERNIPIVYTDGDFDYRENLRRLSKSVTDNLKE